MRLAFLGDGLEGTGGIARYSREVLAALGSRSDLEILVVAPAAVEATAVRLAGSRLDDFLVMGGHDRVSRGLWQRHRLGRVLARRGASVVHGMKHLVPRGDVPAVLTVHDVFALTGSAQFGLAKRIFLPRQYRASIRDATAIVTVSRATRDRLSLAVPGADAKAVVVENGVSRDLVDAVPCPVPALAGRRFALVVGDLSPRKNLGVLLDVWESVHAAANGLVLAVAGPPGWRSRRTQRRLDELCGRGLAVRLGTIDDSELAWCYRFAAVVACPTIEEGFGLPLAEALALGAPVVASDDAALREIGDGVATFVDANDRTAWFETLVNVTGSDHIAPVVTLPTWEGHARGLVEVYEGALRAKPQQ